MSSDANMAKETQVKSTKVRFVCATGLSSVLTSGFSHVLQTEKANLILVESYSKRLGIDMRFYIYCKTFTNVET